MENGEWKMENDFFSFAEKIGGIKKAFFVLRKAFSGCIVFFFLKFECLGMFFLI